MPVQTSLRKVALLSFTAIATLSLAPVLSLPGGKLVAPPAMAKDGGHGGGESHGGESRGGEHSGGEAGHSGDDHGKDSDSDADADSDSDSSSDDDGAGHDVGDDNAAASGWEHSRHHGRDNRGDHANVTLSVSDSELQGLKDGTLKAVDSLGRTLEVEIEHRHGTETVEVSLDGKDNSGGPITGVTLVPGT